VVFFILNVHGHGLPGRTIDKGVKRKVANLVENVGHDGEGDPFYIFCLIGWLVVLEDGKHDGTHRDGWEEAWVEDVDGLHQLVRRQQLGLDELLIVLQVWAVGKRRGQPEEVERLVVVDPDGYKVIKVNHLFS
jgi:hypothetical protein